MAMTNILGPFFGPLGNTPTNAGMDPSNIADVLGQLAGGGSGSTGAGSLAAIGRRINGGGQGQGNSSQNKNQMGSNALSIANIIAAL